MEGNRRLGTCSVRACPPDHRSSHMFPMSGQNKQQHLGYDVLLLRLCSPELCHTNRNQRHSSSVQRHKTNVGLLAHERKGSTAYHSWAFLMPKKLLH